MLVLLQIAGPSTDSASQILLDASARVSHKLGMTTRPVANIPCVTAPCPLQEDNFVPTMTTKETLTFYSNMVIPSSWTSKRRQERVEEVLAAMGLSQSYHTLVGGTLPGGLMLRGLSGGERKRLAVAAGILAAPAVLFLDEPTSGLDSFAALTVMGYLQKMARATSQVVITTIHQPRSAIWQMFDAVTLLANGRLMYYGKTDGMVPWFGRLGYHYDPALHGVASDWALDLVAVGFSKPARYYGETMTTKEQLFAASEAFTAEYTAGAQAVEAEEGKSGLLWISMCKVTFAAMGYPGDWVMVGFVVEASGMVLCSAAGFGSNRAGCSRHGTEVPHIYRVLRMLRLQNAAGG